MAKLHKPSLQEKTFFLISGMIISTPFSSVFTYSITYALAMIASQPLATLLSVGLIAPLLEEFAKIYPLFYRHGETQKSLLTLGFLTGLGFGITEFIFYVFIFGVPLYYRLPALLFHAASTTIAGFGIAKKRIIPFYLIAFVLHAANNFAASFDKLWYFVGIAAIITSYILAWILYHRAREITIK